jgi:hypothetical protein
MADDPNEAALRTLARLPFAVTFSTLKKNTSPPFRRLAGFDRTPGLARISLKTGRIAKSSARYCRTPMVV